MPRNRIRRLISKVLLAAEDLQPWAVQEVFNRMLGKPVQAVEFEEGATMQPLVVHLPIGVLAKLEPATGDPPLEALEGEFKEVQDGEVP